MLRAPNAILLPTAKGQTLPNLNVFSQRPPRYPVYREQALIRSEQALMLKLLDLSAKTPKAKEEQRASVTNYGLKLPGDALQTQKRKG